MNRLVINMRDSRAVWSIPDWAIEEIRNAAPEGSEVVVVGSMADGRGDGGAAAAEAIDAIQGAEIHLGFGFPRTLFEAARRGDALRWVHSGSAGVGGALYPEMRASAIAFTNSAGIHAEPMADTVMAMVHYFARGLDFAVHAQRARRWDSEPFDSLDTPLVELADGTIGILGLGGIGRAVAARAHTLGMRVLAWRRRPRTAPEGVELLRGDSGLSALLQQSNFIILAIPRTTATERLLDAQRIGLLRPDAVVINVGRGELIDEDALAESLRTHRIRGAGLDVFSTEPLPENSPLWGLRNLLITPHVSATTNRFWRREVGLIVENLGRYQRGEPLVNLVDKHAGY